ncbi:hypothetical protein [Ferdinandcohnia sp. Marseille-Q9671]
MLSNQDLWKLFNNAFGIKDAGIVFEQVVCSPSVVSKKGLYVSIKKEKSDESLKRALDNGAIGAVWPKGEKLPRFLPNHFPVFLVNDTLQALRQIVELYEQKIEENRYDTMTKFILFTDEKEMNYEKNTIDEMKKLTNKLAMIEEGRG